MASQNTVSRDKLTVADKRFIDYCRKISTIITGSIPEYENKQKFLKEYGKIHDSRDAGLGLAAGKLQRDALTTRGKQVKAPLSNRNLRWHPLTLSMKLEKGFEKMNLQIDSKKKQLRFIPNDDKNSIYTPETVYQLPKPYSIVDESWTGLEKELREWSLNDWMNNWCGIPILEYSPANYCIETFSVLGISISVALYGANLDDVYQKVTSFLKTTEFGLSGLFPKCSDSLINCPICNTPITNYPAGLQSRERPRVWKPSWQSSKRSEGEDESIQLTHTTPLIETEINHNPRFVRYGHRWCNVAMTDHSLMDFYKYCEAVIMKRK